MAKIGLFYGSNTGNSEFVADMIKEEFDKIIPNLVEVFDIGQVDVEKLLDYEMLIIGCPTWYIGHLQEDWETAYPRLKELDFSGKRVAIFGIGDQFGYSDNFCDAIGILGHTLEEQGGELVGFTPVVDYELDSSLGVEDGVFLGLALDEDNQSELTPGRVSEWVSLLIEEFELVVMAP